MSEEIITIASILFVIILLLLSIVIGLIILLCRSSGLFQFFDRYHQQNKKIRYKRVLTSTTKDRYICLKQSLN